MADLVVLAGGVGWSAEWPYALSRTLLPVGDRTLLEHLLRGFQPAVDGDTIVCANGEAETIAASLPQSPAADWRLRLHKESVPRGTAGCLRDALGPRREQTCFVTGASLWLDDDPQWLLDQHRRSGHALSVFCAAHPGENGVHSRRLLRPTGLYCCEPDVLPFIRPSGFQDLKEQLVPELLREGIKVGAIAVRSATRELCDWTDYLEVLKRAYSEENFAGTTAKKVSGSAWVSPGATLAPDSRLLGPCFLGTNSHIGPGSTLVGPVSVGAGCRVGSNCTIIRSVLLSGVDLAPGSRCVERIVERTPRAAVGCRSGAGTHGPVAHPRTSRRTMSWLAGAVPILTIFGLFLWAFASPLASLYEVLRDDPDYSAGFLVPFAVLYMIAARAGAWRNCGIQFWGLGIGVFAFAAAMNVVGSVFRYSSLENLSIVVAANGIVMSIVGPRAYRRIWAPLAFLLLMLPLPHVAQHAVLYPLQGLGARVAGNLLETAGIPTERYGHVLEVAGHKIAVAEACSGLRLALAFLIVTAVVAYTVQRPLWQKVIVFASSIPIALACNVIRVVLSAYLYYAGLEWLAQGAFHDGAGLVMMPLALVMVLAEFWILSTLVVPDRSETPFAETTRHHEAAAVAPAI